MVAAAEVRVQVPPLWVQVEAAALVAFNAPMDVMAIVPEVVVESVKLPVLLAQLDVPTLVITIVPAD